MKKIYLILCILAFNIAVANAQTLKETVEFSRSINTNSARSSAMGGAFTALGGDISSISLNPAAVGVFHGSEFTLTLSPNFMNVKSSGLLGNDKESSSTYKRLQLGNIGAVLHFGNDMYGWKGINVGFNYTTQNNYNIKTDRFINNSSNSLTDVFAAQSNGYNINNLNSFGAGLAYDAKLIYAGNNNNYFSILEYENSEGSTIFDNVSQHEMVKNNGHQGEFTFSLGSNYMDKLYIGGSIGFEDLEYKNHYAYTEAAEEGASSGVDYYDYLKYEKYSGVGINFKFGVIYRPVYFLRLGASIHTPTWYNIDYTVSSGINSFFSNNSDASSNRNEDQYFVRSGDYDTSFDFRTPWKFQFGIATVIDKYAIISIDYERVDYSSSKFYNADDNYDYSYLNNDIKNNLRSTNNLRLGFEIRFDFMSLRAGYSMQDSPYSNNTSDFNDITSASLGMGLNLGQFFIDAAYVNKKMKNNTIFYSYGDSNNNIESAETHNKYSRDEVKITFGLRF